MDGRHVKVSLDAIFNSEMTPSDRARMDNLVQCVKLNLALQPDHLHIFLEAVHALLSSPDFSQDTRTRHRETYVLAKTSHIQRIIGDLETARLKLYVESNRLKLPINIPEHVCWIMQLRSTGLDVLNRQDRNSAWHTIRSRPLGILLAIRLG